jgi:hypothetical protein
MKPVLIKWEDGYSIGFYVRENKKELFLATEYSGGEYRDIISIPIKAIKERQPLIRRGR